MQKSAFLLAALLLPNLVASLVASPAHAKVGRIYGAGDWAVYAGRSNDGAKVCVMSTHWNDGRYVGIKRFGADHYLTVQASRPNWRFDGGDVRVSVTMDNFTPWHASAITEAGHNLLQFQVPGSAVGEFTHELDVSSHMVLTMGNNNVTWPIDLIGTSRATEAFVSCLKAEDQTN